MLGKMAIGIIGIQKRIQMLGWSQMLTDKWMNGQADGKLDAYIAPAC